MTQPTPDTHLLMLYTLFKAIRPPESLFRWEGTLRIYLVYANSLKLTVWLIMVDTTTGPPFQSTRTSTCPVQQGRTLRINATALNAQIAGRSWPANVYGEHGRQPPEPIQTCFIYIYIWVQYINILDIQIRCIRRNLELMKVLHFVYFNVKVDSFRNRYLFQSKIGSFGFQAYSIYIVRYVNECMHISIHICGCKSFPTVRKTSWNKIFQLWLSGSPMQKWQVILRGFPNPQSPTIEGVRSFVVHYSQRIGPICFSFPVSMVVVPKKPLRARLLLLTYTL